jgi:hypothetical protein
LAEYSREYTQGIQKLNFTVTYFTQQLMKLESTAIPLAPFDTEAIFPKNQKITDSNCL